MQALGKNLRYIGEFKQVAGAQLVVHGYPIGESFFAKLRKTGLPSLTRTLCPFILRHVQMPLD
jgi:hypothetical protein